MSVKSVDPKDFKLIDCNNMEVDDSLENFVRHNEKDGWVRVYHDEFVDVRFLLSDTLSFYELKVLSTESKELLKDKLDAVIAGCSYKIVKSELPALAIKIMAEKGRQKFGFVLDDHSDFMSDRNTHRISFNLTVKLPERFVKYEWNNNKLVELLYEIYYVALEYTCMYGLRISKTA